MIDPRELIDLVRDGALHATTGQPPASPHDRVLHALAHVALGIGALLLVVLVGLAVASVVHRWRYLAQQRRRRGPIGGPFR